jgi:hypothetical protein
MPITDTSSEVIENLESPPDIGARLVTVKELKTLHDSNILRIVSMERGQEELKQAVDRISTDTAEVVEWVRSGKVAGKVLANIGVVLTKAGAWAAKIIGIVAILYSAYVAIRAGRMPDIKFFP